jgi:hypothetical protein
MAPGFEAFDNFDSYAVGGYLNGQGGWVDTAGATGYQILAGGGAGGTQGIGPSNGSNQGNWTGYAWDWGTLAVGDKVVGATMNAQGALVWDLGVEYLPQSVELFAETGGVQSVYVNGTEAGLTPCRLWGVHNEKCEAAPLLRVGQNHIVVIFRAPDYCTPYLVPFVFLAGRFETDGISMQKPLDCHTASPVNRQGFPHLAGETVYRFTKTLSASDAASACVLSLSSLDAAEVAVNGKSAGTRLWAPFDFDVAGLLREGGNVFEVRLTLPMANLMGDPIDCGLTDAPVLYFRQG